MGCRTTRLATPWIREAHRAAQPGQLDCLRLVDQHLSSKEIAGELGISPHTVDQRIRHALQILGVERRTQAARLVAAAQRAISAFDTSIAVH